MIDDKLFDSEGDPPVKQLRMLLGMSQFEFAVLVGVTPSTVSRWEDGKGRPSFTPGGFKRLLEALAPYGLTLNDLPDDLGRAGQS
ncbi:helix-turn-helix domain-containing protein [Nodosilinea sp. AN01ver1]|uniref:helix-turn-helix domain-containing protein n=1 Tax=Nodosilinea sp. AN01ver1 TaxID=3423362 RepID=UPI003D310CA8